MTIRQAVLMGSFAVAAVGTAQTPTLPQPRPLPGTVTPSETTKLRTELEALQKERDRAVPGEDPAEAKRRTDRIQLRLQLIELLKQLQDRPATPAPPAAPPPKANPAPVKSMPVTGEIDPIAAAVNLYQANDVDAAHLKFSRIPLDGLSTEDKTFVKYMTACCLRRMGKSSEALDLYRDVSVEKAVPFLAENAVWQIGVIKTTLELESQLKDLRPRKNSPAK